MAGVPDFKQAPRVVDRLAVPLDPSPGITGVCPICHRLARAFSRHHVVPKGQGGDDVPENLVWLCGDGTKGCHGVLTHRNRDGATGMTFETAGRELIRYCRRVAEVGAYSDRVKHPGWLESYYGSVTGELCVA